MKLELKGCSIMLCASLLLLAGCKHKSGLELLSSQMTEMKAMKSQYVIQAKGQKDIVVDFLFSKPSRILATSSDFVLGCNEVDGHFESIFSTLVYDAAPWDRKVYPGTGKLVNPDSVMGGPVCSMSPSSIAPTSPWKLEGKSGNVERYTKTVRSDKGDQTFKLEVDSQGMPVKFIGPTGLVFVTKTFEITDEIAVEKFHVEPREGFVNFRIYPDSMDLQVGSKFDYSKFQVAAGMERFRLEGNTLFAIIDPNEPSSKAAALWIALQTEHYKKIPISVGKATTGFFDPSGDLIRKMTTSTPTFVLVNKESQIIGLWLGFDPENTKDFAADILKAIG